MKVMAYKISVCLLLASSAIGWTQTPAPPNASQSPAEMEKRIEAISSALTTTQQQLEQSQRQIQQLQQELLQLRQQMTWAGVAPAGSTAATAATTTPDVSSSSVSTSAPPTGTTEEQLQVLEAAVRLHDQTKIESASKYPIRVTGLVLFNGFLNKGVPDNIDLPAVATRQTATSGNGSAGASLRQAILGLEGDGPRIGGARTSASINIDFFNGVAYSNYGTSAGVVRMRTASINFDWSHDAIEVGMVAPLVSPLSPSSYATVAEPSLAGAGNLWTWAPQLRYIHRFAPVNGRHLQFEFGLWDSASAGYNSNQLFRNASPAEQSKQPAYETRISYGSSGDRGLQLGLGGYYSRQSYTGYQSYYGSQHLDSWGGTLDWRIPFAHSFEVSGEGYRGRALGGLGGGVYKDVVMGTDPVSGLSVAHGLNAIGGWTQFKTRFGQSLETNLAIGLDDGLARDFHALTLSPTATASQLRARNKMVMGNLIFRPKTYIILSPEYRRIWTWSITGPASTADVFTLSAGYQF